MGLRAAGFSLVEALLAIAITMIVAAVLAVSQQSLRRALGLTQGRDTDRIAVLQALDLLAAELRSAADPDGPDASPLRLAVGDDGRWTLRFFARLRPADEPDLRYARTFRLRYEAHTESDGRVALRREMLPLDPRAETETPLNGPALARLRSWRARFFDGEQWQERWPIGDNSPRLPRAVRLEVEDLEGRAAAVETWIARDTWIAPARDPGVLDTDSDPDTDADDSGVGKVNPRHYARPPQLVYQGGSRRTRR